MCWTAKNGRVAAASATPRSSANTIGCFPARRRGNGHPNQGIGTWSVTLQTKSSLEQRLIRHRVLIAKRRIDGIRHRGPVATGPLALVKTLIRQLEKRLRRGGVSIENGTQSA